MRFSTRLLFATIAIAAVCFSIGNYLLRGPRQFNTFSLVRAYGLTDNADRELTSFLESQGFHEIDPTINVSSSDPTYNFREFAKGQAGNTTESVRVGSWVQEMRHGHGHAGQVYNINLHWESSPDYIWHHNSNSTKFRERAQSLHAAFTSYADQTEAISIP